MNIADVTMFVDVYSRPVDTHQYVVQCVSLACARLHMDHCSIPVAMGCYCCAYSHHRGCSVS